MKHSWLFAFSVALGIHIGLWFLPFLSLPVLKKMHVSSLLVRVHRVSLQKHHVEKRKSSKRQLRQSAHQAKRHVTKHRKRRIDKRKRKRKRKRVRTRRRRRKSIRRRIVTRPLAHQHSLRKRHRTKRQTAFAPHRTKQRGRRFAQKTPKRSTQAVVHAKRRKKKRVDLQKYGLVVYRKIQRQKHYPLLARKMGFEGSLLVRVEIKKNGSLYRKPTILRSSGFAILDQEAIRMVKAASPFDAVPKGFQGERVVFALPIRFQLD